MKRLSIISILLVCLIFTAFDGHAGGPWGKSIRGSGTLNYEGQDNGQTIGVESHIVWNIKLNTESGEINGHLSISEKLENGTMRHFRLSSDQMQTEGNPADSPTYFCEINGQMTRTARVVGVTDKETIKVLFDDASKTVLYEVSYAPTNPNTDSSTTIGTGDPISLNGRMTLDCGDTSQNSQTGRISDSTSNGSIYLPIILSPSGN